MLRRNYARELSAFAILPLMLGGLQSGTMAVVLKKTFNDVPGLDPSTLDFAVATMGASTALGNLTSGIWASMANGRRKVRFITALMLTTALTVGLMALVPRTAIGAWMLVAMVVIGWTTWSGVITIRTSVWRANYPDADRAKIAGKLATMQAIMLAIAGFVIGASLDVSPNAFRVVFPVLAATGLLGILIFSRVRLRGQNRVARLERSDHGKPNPSINPLATIKILRDDPAYAKYMICQFIFGVGNLMIAPTIAIILDNEFSASYLSALLITSIIPPLMMPMAIPLWARFLDRVHVIRYRAVHSWAFVLASLLMLLGVELHQFWLLMLGSAVLGIGFAGGMLAWNLGHQHFAPPHLDMQYMSVHVILTGIRGVFAPYLGVFIYVSFAAYGHGGLVYAVSLVLNIIGAIGFIMLSRQLKPTRSER